MSADATYEQMYEDLLMPWAKRQLGPVDWTFLQDAPPYYAYLLKDLFKATTGGYCYGYDYNFTENECGFDHITYWDYTSVDSAKTGERVSCPVSHNLYW